MAQAAAEQGGDIAAGVSPWATGGSLPVSLQGCRDAAFQPGSELVPGAGAALGSRGQAGLSLG